MEPRPSFMINSTLIYQLHKVLYGLKQAPKAWHAKIDSSFMSLGFKHCEFGHSLYVLRVNGNTLIVVVYLDDLVITRNNLDIILGLKRQLVATFVMIDLGIMHYFLGLQVFPLFDGVFIS